MSSELKKRKPNWSERELLGLSEAVAPRNKFLKGKLCPGLTTEKKNDTWVEIANQVNSVTMVYRTVDEIKKKWADMQSMTKKKEGERRRTMAKTGGGPAPEFYFKEWEKVVLQTLSDIAIEGISSGVDTAECITAPSPVSPSDLSHTPSQLTLIPSSDISQSPTIPCTSNSQQFVDPLTQDVSFMYNADMNAEKECSRSVENRKKQARAPRQES